MQKKVIAVRRRESVEQICRKFLRNKNDLVGEICFAAERTILRLRVRSCSREFTDVHDIEINSLGKEICARCGLSIHRAEKASSSLYVIDLKIAA